MPAYLPPTLAIGGPLLFAIVFFIWSKRTLDGARAPIVVVDDRTMRLAQKRIAEAMAHGDLSRANAGATALIVWLRFQVRTGLRARRPGYAAALEQAELIKSQIAEKLCLPEYTV